jgi:hypothetical protein
LRGLRQSDHAIIPVLPFVLAISDRRCLFGRHYVIGEILQDGEQKLAKILLVTPQTGVPDLLRPRHSSAGFYRTFSLAVNIFMYVQLRRYVRTSS